MQSPIFLKPYHAHKIWGHEEWVISAHPNGPALVIDGEFSGQSLADVWHNQPELFGVDTSEPFPLLIKELFVQDDLSIQVHPNDAYAFAHEGELGKTEAWYVLNAQDGTEVVYGHTAPTKEVFDQLVDNDRFEELIRLQPLHTGDFLFVPSGTIHALKAGSTIYEVQQSSDTTYRLYDYNRVDEQTGEKRELHIQAAKDVTTIPHHVEPFEPIIEFFGKSIVTTWIKSPFFKIYRFEIKELTHFEAKAPYSLISVIEGNGRLIIEDSTYELQKDMHFILPNGVSRYELDGNMTLMVTTPPTQ